MRHREYFHLMSRQMEAFFFYFELYFPDKSFVSLMKTVKLNDTASQPISRRIISPNKAFHSVHKWKVRTSTAKSFDLRKCRGLFHIHLGYPPPGKLRPDFPNSDSSYTKFWLNSLDSKIIPYPVKYSRIIIISSNRPYLSHISSYFSNAVKYSWKKHDLNFAR